MTSRVTPGAISSAPPIDSSPERRYSGAQIVDAAPARNRSRKAT